MKIRSLDSRSEHFITQKQVLLSSIEEPTTMVEEKVKTILADVRAKGDVALLEYTNRLDQRSVEITDLEIPAAQLQKAKLDIPANFRQALETATARIREYHDRQRSESWTYQDEYGNTLGQQIRPLDRVGVYVPGGLAIYPSSVLMNAIPAQVAGVGEIIMVVPAPQGKVSPMVLAAANIAGVKRVFSVGGAQAIAALAYGTELVPKVDKIVGPGNIWVTTAKRQVFGTVGIDMIAGPSEILVISDGSSNADWVAIDLFSQAEHDENACAILLCTNQHFLKQVEDSIHRLLPKMERADIIAKSLEKRGALILVRDLQEAVALSNEIAPEHLQLSIANAESLLPDIRHAGAIFIGHYAAEVLGDYCAGPSHVLPTAGTARFSSPLGVYDFQKRSSLINCTAQSAAKLAGTAALLARGEGLTAHACSAEYRAEQVNFDSSK